MASSVTRTAHPQTSKAVVTALFVSISCLAVVLIFLIPPSSKVLFPAFDHVKATGMYPDGVPIRRRYTGNGVLDYILTGLGGFFSAAVDGRDEATRMFCFWFLPQLCGVLVFCYWEAGRANRSLVRFPTLVSILAQLSTAGVTLPLYFMSYVRNMPKLPVALPSEPLSRARTVFLAVMLGYIVPSAALLVPSNISLDTKQIIAAFWQPFPLYITIVYNACRKVDALLRFSKPLTRTEETKEALFWIKCSYYACAVISTLSHMITMLPSFFTSDPAYTFANVFVPYYLHPYLPWKPIKASLPEYRVAARLLFQHDWLTMTMGALLFFAWSYHVTRSAPVGPWVARMVFMTGIGGPGTAIAWAAVEREERIFRNIAVKSKNV